MQTTGFGIRSLCGFRSPSDPSSQRKGASGTSTALAATPYSSCTYGKLDTRLFSGRAQRARELLASLRPQNILD